MNSRKVTLAIVAALCVCLLIGLGLRYRMAGRQGGRATRTGPVSYEEGRARAFDEAQAQAFSIIRQRERWPESPEAVCKTFGKARAAKNYAEMEVLWPGSGSWNWPELCRNEPNVACVFGQASADGTAVPYASKEHCETQGTYNLTMRLRVPPTDKGSRYYIVSGN